MALPVRHLRPTPAPAPASRPALKVVRPPRRQRARIPFFALCLMILAGAMLTALVLNTSMARTAYEIHSTQIELARTHQSNAEQAAKVDRLSAPTRLAEKAESLGMVPGEEVTYINLGNQTLIPTAGTHAKDQ